MKTTDMKSPAEKIKCFGVLFLVNGEKIPITEEVLKDMRHGKYTQAEVAYFSLFE